MTVHTEEAQVVWMDGRLVPWAQATVHLVSNSLHYGFAAFEGIRCYETPRGPCVFRLREHIERLFNTAKILGLAVPYSPEEILRACCETVAANGLGDCYIRPIAYIGRGGMGLEFDGLPVNVAIAVWHWGAYLGDVALRDGIRVKVSSFTRYAGNVMMTKAKASGNYLMLQLARAEARAEGYDEALLLDPQGHVAEGSVENIFLARRGGLVTPPVTAILEGVTRGAILEMAAHEGMPVREEFFPRDLLYTADEAFFCGTGAEVTPIREVDRRVIGDGTPGPLTRRLQRLFADVTRGASPAFAHWLTPVRP